MVFTKSKIFKIFKICKFMEEFLIQIVKTGTSPTGLDLGPLGRGRKSVKDEVFNAFGLARAQARAQLRTARRAVRLPNHQTDPFGVRLI